ncbi:adenylate/guanylate cyclase domain-containing protein [Gracilibacillus suaedae]|uniref:adenylate/guanylate cyclase domain-containing protein n=1 Tax=Gracilibacillus suaedae TaxID=2820273 RepID=UPI001ABE6776|nr:adenylate/guanylate cyclase domain-containing protein [Gracilibacillus suaedae]
MNFVSYDYKERKKKVEEILDNTDKIEEVDKLPSEDNFTYTNGYKAWVSAIFIDLRDSTNLFTKHEELDIAKVIRGFTSEIIEILRKDTNNQLKEIGIRGDCVFAIYSTPVLNDLYDVSTRAVYVNTYMNMLNKLLKKRNLPTINAGIGLGLNKILAVKAGRKSSGINNLVWIGEAVAKASKLSDLGNKNGIRPIVMSDIFFTNYIEIEKEKNSNKDVENWWKQEFDFKIGSYYHGNIIVNEFNDWITNEL